jgi:TM2 domain-containing membrane protein YozV
MSAHLTLGGPLGRRPAARRSDARYIPANSTRRQMTDKRILPAFLLCFFLGVFGAHRFYVGKTGTAILMIVTLGGLGIWALADLIMIVVGAFKDSEGVKITKWT